MAARLALQATTSVRTEVKLEPKARTMALQRAEEHAKLAKVIKDATARQKRIRKEVEEIFVKAKQGKALANGVELDGFKFKMVCGTSKRLNKEKLVELGCDPDWIAEATDESPNEPYVKVTAPGEKADE